MDIRDLLKVLILICALVYPIAGIMQDFKSLETSNVGKDGKRGRAQHYDTVVTTPEDFNYKLSYADYELTWRSFKQKHNKRYSSNGEENRRFAIFVEKVKAIEAHNMEYHLSRSTYWMDINRFSDWTQEEFKDWLGTRDAHSRSKREADYSHSVYIAIDDAKLPEAIDWRDEGYVTPVKNQGGCGSCYAFSTTGAVEGQWYRKTGELISLSEQQIVDCATDFGDDGCDGGDAANSFRYIISAGGLQNNSTYPYNDTQNSCKFNESLVVAQITGYYTVAQNEQALKSAVGTQGPVSVAVFSSDNFTDYAGGIYDDQACEGEFNLTHAVLVVGYGSSNGTDYWIVKNSWGSNWGESGYVRMARNTGGMGLCGIAQEASFPDMSEKTTLSPDDSTSSPDDSTPSLDGSNTLENNAIFILVTSALVLLKFTQLDLYF